MKKDHLYIHFSLGENSDIQIHQEYKNKIIHSNIRAIRIKKKRQYKWKVS